MSQQVIKQCPNPTCDEVGINMDVNEKYCRNCGGRMIQITEKQLEKNKAKGPLFIVDYSNKIEKKGITTLSYKVADAIRTMDNWELQEFAEKGKVGEMILYAHYHFFYSYPEFGKKWANDKSSCYHEVDVRCYLCGERPDRNFAGIGSIYLAKASAALPRFVCLCRDHTGINTKFGEKRNSPKQQIKQLELF